ncbi:hypothetical protein CAB17_11465 [Legionella sainthelensi]|uniref:Uncharacterized protein n=3 Tax=Legionella sainthelensi TaxID=28087 RepID=A0A2H5FM39_9GAMM|nr:hypothetical protein CAB17_11465 [Legionella sainthelensi]
MNLHNKLNVLIILCSNILINQNLFAHGYQTAPYSRTANAVDSGQSSLLYYNPNQISNNLPNNLGSKSLKELIDYTSEINGTGPLAFYKDYYNVHGDELCAYSTNNHGYLPILNKSIPVSKMTEVSLGDPIQFKWGYSAWHSPSNNFVFTTQYPSGHYKPNPSWDDLHFVCSVAADSTGAWQCKLPSFENADSKQVIVTIWQRVDPAGENFISCADVKVENGTVVPPERIWKLLENQSSWTSDLIEQPKIGDIVSFTLVSENEGSRNKSILAKLSLLITDSNLSKWNSILASKINNDAKYSKMIAIGQLNFKQGNIIFNENEPNNNYVYLNTTVIDPELKYSYFLANEKDSKPVAREWQKIGEPLKIWVNSNNVKANDELQFALQTSGVEQKLEAVVIDDPQNAEKLIAEEVTKSKFDNLKVAVGVLLANGKQPEVQYIESGDNRVYVYRSSDDITNISYVIRNLTQSQTYPVYPEGIGKYKAGSMVQNDGGQVYMCLESGWCNQSTYELTSEGAWKAVNPKSPPNGYLTYPVGQPYNYENIAADIEGNLYKCIQPAWCNDKSGAYSPGFGRAWFHAWEKQ